VGHAHCRDSHDAIVEARCAIPRGTWGRRRDRNVDGPNERTRVGHMDVEGHDVQVVGVAGQDVVDEVGDAGKRSLGVDGRLPSERGIACGSVRRRGGAVDDDRGSGPPSAPARTPQGYRSIPVRSPVWSTGRCERKTASRRVKSRPASAKADGAPRPQSIRKIRPSTTRAEAMPPRPGTGMGAPAVPSSTNSVVIGTPSLSRHVSAGVGGLTRPEDDPES
jgi:hypothetical protein